MLNTVNKASAASDPIELVLLHNRLTSICREMGVAMMHTAYSPVFSEGFDFVCALFDRDGKMMAQGRVQPVDAGRGRLRSSGCGGAGRGRVRSGRRVVHNDPYRGGCHLPEHMLHRGVFHEGELFGFAATIGHMAEIGGGDGRVARRATRRRSTRRACGSRRCGSMRARRARDGRLEDHDDEPPHPKLDLGRPPRDARLAARSPSGGWRGCSTAAGLGLGAVWARADGSVRSGWMRSEIEAIPDGEYAFEDVMDDDGHHGSR